MAESGAADNISLAGLFQVLKQIRSRAGLTQQQIAEATGAGGRHGHKLIARLEAGHIPNPSVRLVLDYLRACRATSHDLTDFLDGYFGAPLSLPTRPHRGRRPALRHDRSPVIPRESDGSRNLARNRVPGPSRDAGILALRKEAAWWNVRKVVEFMLHHELNESRMKPMSKERKLAADFGRKVFRILYQTRQSRAALRARRLARCRAWAERKALPAETLDYLYKVVSEFFGDMEAKGELDWLPLPADAKHLMLLPPRYRLQTDYDICRSEYLARMLKEHEAREAARKPVIEAALNLLRSKGLTENQIGNYRSIITAFLNVAETTETGSTARAQRVKEIVRGHQQSYIDQALLHRLPELIFTLRDQRV